MQPSIQNIPPKYRPLLERVLRLTRYKPYIEEGVTSSKYFEFFVEFARVEPPYRGTGLGNLYNGYDEISWGKFDRYSKGFGPDTEVPRTLFLACAELCDNRAPLEHLAVFLNKWFIHRAEFGWEPSFSEYSDQIDELLARYGLRGRVHHHGNARLAALDDEDVAPREGLFRAIADYIEDSDSGYVALSGITGTGKSWITSQCVQSIPDLVSKDVCLGWYFNETDASTTPQFHRVLLSQLDSIYDLEGYPASEREEIGSPDFARHLLDYLASSGQFAKRPLVFIIDALDEIAKDDPSAPPSLNTLFLPSYLPADVFLIVSSRSFQKESTPPNALHIELSEDGDYQTDDIYFYIDQKLDDPSIIKALKSKGWSGDPENLRESLIQASQHQFVYLKHLFQNIEEFDPNTPPPGMEALYEREYERALTTERETRKTVKSVLRCLREFGDRCSLETILRYTKLSTDDLEHHLDTAYSNRLITKYFDEQGYPRLKVCHDTFFVLLSDRSASYMAAELHSAEHTQELSRMLDQVNFDFSRSNATFMWDSRNEGSKLEELALLFHLPAATGRYSEITDLLTSPLFVEEVIKLDGRRSPKFFRALAETYAYWKATGEDGRASEFVDDFNRRITPRENPLIPLADMQTNGVLNGTGFLAHYMLSRVPRLKT
ncbi:MAG: ATP-binding protein [Pseudomonadaceae bacterium]|nr:ATP-binding protein [Pseudomonadaceae bacterium]